MSYNLSVAIVYDRCGNNKSIDRVVEKIYISDDFAELLSKSVKPIVYVKQGSLAPIHPAEVDPDVVLKCIDIIKGTDDKNDLYYDRLKSFIVDHKPQFSNTFVLLLC